MSRRNREGECSIVQEGLTVRANLNVTSAPTRMQERTPMPSNPVR